MQETKHVQPVGDEPVAYEPPKLVVLGDVAELTQAHCVNEHGHIFCTST